MTKTIAALLAAALVAGCASTATAPQQSYRPRGADAPLSITGQLSRNEGFLSADHALIVSINGTPAITGSIADGNRDLSGNYAGKPIAALCNRQGGYSDSYSIHCRIIVDGEFAATLSF